MFENNFGPELEDRLVRYARIDTQSSETSDTTPSTACQLDLLNLLAEELRGIGAAEVTTTDYATVLATIPATVENAPVMGWLAHVDTSPAFRATGVTPRVVRNYDGGEIRFPDAPDLVLSPDVAPTLAQKTGHDIITASGTTLLGADNKSGIAIIMTAARHLLSHPELPHGPIRIAFTSDEEIGSAVDQRLTADLGADLAYTFDGGEPGRLDYETFSADLAVISIKGVSTHTGTAKDVLVNAMQIAGDIIAGLPRDHATPETTDGRDGFLHLNQITGNAAEVTLWVNLRDFERQGLEDKGTLLRDLCARVGARHPRACISVRIEPKYRNMRYWLDDDMGPVDLARAAYRAIGIEPVSSPIRGGTDGSRLTELGIPTPNIFTGQMNLHGPLEWISVTDMTLSTRVALTLATLAAGDPAA